MADTDPRLLRLSPEDNIAAVTQALAAGETIAIAGRQVALPRAVPTGHKVAVCPIAAGAKVVKYGAPIGSATCDIRLGDYVHTHNLKSDYLPTFTRDGGGPHQS
jgi:hypothetical protein